MKKYVLIGLCALTITSLTLVPSLDFNFELEELFPKTDSDITFYNKHVETFGYDNDFISMMVLPEHSVYEWSFLKKLSRVIDELEKVEGVEWVFSPTQMRKTFMSPTGLVSFPVFKNAASLSVDSTFIANDDYLRKLLPSDRFINLTLRHAHFDDHKKSAELLHSLESIMMQSELNFKWIGKTIAESAFLGYIKSDFLIFLSLAISLSILSLYFITQSILNALYPVFVGVLSLLWVFGFMSFMHVPINIMTSLLAPMLIFTSSSDTIHLLSANQKTQNRKRAVQAVFIPTALTSLTTAIGFFSLMIVDVNPIQILGLTAGLGTLFAFIITYGLSPYFLQKNQKSTRLKPYFSRFIDFQERNRRGIYLFFGLLALVGIYGTSQLQVDARLLEDLPENSSVRQEFQFADSLLGGSKPMEVVIEIKDSTSNIWRPEVLREIEKITTYLEDEFPLSNTISISSVVKYASFLRGNGDGLELLDQPTINLTKRILHQRKAILVDQDQSSTRIIGYIKEYGSKNTFERNNKMLKVLDESVNQKLISYRITGTNYLIDKSHNQLAQQILSSLLAAIGLVSVLLGIYFRSFRIAMIALVPNLIPLLLLGSCIYIFQIPIQLSTSIIFTLAFGIVVDDTIHFLAMYRKALSEGQEKPMIHTLEHAGMGMINTSLALVFGFSTFMFSSFGATFYLGVFLCLSLFMALLTDFILLPLLLTKQKT